MKQKYYMISDAAKKVNVESHVLRYWEEELALPITRNEMGHRCYTEENILLFQNIKCLKDQGFALKAVRLLLPELSRRTPQSLTNLFLLREQLNQRAEEIDAGSSDIHDTAVEEVTAGGSEPHRTAAGAEAETGSGGESAAAETDSGKSNAAEETEDGGADAVPQKKNSGSNAAQTKRTAAKKHSQASVRRKPETEHTNLPAASECDPDVPTPAEQKLLQFQSLVGHAVAQAVTQSVGSIVQEQIQHGVKQALADNNRKLVQDMSRQLSCDICEDLDGLLQEREQRDEERYRNLDNAIRERQRVHKEAAAVNLDRLSGRAGKKLRKNQQQPAHCALLPAKKNR